MFDRQTYGWCCWDIINSSKTAVNIEAKIIALYKLFKNFSRQIFVRFCKVFLNNK